MQYYSHIKSLHNWYSLSRNIYCGTIISMFISNKVSFLCYIVFFFFYRNDFDRFLLLYINFYYLVIVQNIWEGFGKSKIIKDVLSLDVSKGFCTVPFFFKLLIKNNFFLAWFTRSTLRMCWNKCEVSLIPCCTLVHSLTIIYKIFRHSLFKRIFKIIS